MYDILVDYLFIHLYILTIENEWLNLYYLVSY